MVPQQADSGMRARAAFINAFRSLKRRHPEKKPRGKSAGWAFLRFYVPPSLVIQNDQKKDALILAQTKEATKILADRLLATLFAANQPTHWCVLSRVDPSRRAA